MITDFAPTVTEPRRVLSLSNCALEPTLGSGKIRLRLAAGLRVAGFQVQSKAPSDIMRNSAPRPGWRFRLAWEACRRVTVSGTDLMECSGAEMGLLQRSCAARRPRPMIVARTDGLEFIATERMRGIEPVRWQQRLTAPLHGWLELAGFRHADALAGRLLRNILRGLRHYRGRGLLRQISLDIHWNICLCRLLRRAPFTK